jgi:uncharacterized integral membrane protein
LGPVAKPPQSPEITPAIATLISLLLYELRVGRVLVVGVLSLVLATVFVHHAGKTVLVRWTFGQSRYPTGL